MLNPTIQVIPLSDYPLDKLEQEWNSLFNRSAGCFFLSWNWIGSWLSILPTFDDVYVVRAVNCSHSLNGYALDDLLGFGIFCETKVRRHGFVKSKQWHLHRTGNEKLDQIWIEYNDLLLVKNPLINKQVEKAIWQYVNSNNKYSPDEILVNLAANKALTSLITSLDKKVITQKFIGYRKSTSDFDPQTLFTFKSKSTIKQITKTKRLLNNLGSYEIEHATDPTTVLSNLRRTQKWHIKKWEQTNTPSGFKNRAFIKFHERLLTYNDESSEYNVLAVTLKLNKEIVGVNYCFYDSGSIYFYLACLKPFDDNRLKVGQLLHFYTMTIAKDENRAYYDFLAGDQSYKSKLSDEKVQFECITIQKKKFVFKLESCLSWIKNTLKNSIWKSYEKS